MSRNLNTLHAALRLGIPGQPQPARKQALRLTEMGRLMTLINHRQRVSRRFARFRRGCLEFLRRREFDRFAGFDGHSFVGGGIAPLALRPFAGLEFA